MSIRNLLLGTFLALLSSTWAVAAPITFTATGSPGISGYVQFDDSSFNGTAFQFVSNTAITDLMLTVFGQSYALGDVDATASTIIDSSGAIPIIVNGAGILADNGVESIAFFPDGFGGIGLDGDASLVNFPAAGGIVSTAVRWEVTSQAPEPGTLALLGLGLAGLAASRRRKQ